MIIIITVITAIFSSFLPVTSSLIPHLPFYFSSYLLSLFQFHYLCLPHTFHYTTHPFFCSSPIHFSFSSSSSSFLSHRCLSPSPLLLLSFISLLHTSSFSSLFLFILFSSIPLHSLPLCLLDHDRFLFLGLDQRALESFRKRTLEIKKLVRSRVNEESDLAKVISIKLFPLAFF